MKQTRECLARRLRNPCAAGALAAVVATTLGVTPHAAAAAPVGCAALLASSFKDTTITSATALAAGATVGSVPVTVPVCRVVAVVSTQPTEQVGIEVWLPANWNGRFEGLGSGGFGGSINTASLAAAAARGFAAANTDTGHVGQSSGAIGQTLPWAQSLVTLTDWGKTSVHLMTDSAKAISKAYYGKAADYAYFDGCSTGGAEAMEEAEFFPEDYDGIHAGSPGMDYSHCLGA